MDKRNDLLYFKRPYCNGFQTDIERDYERRIVTKHPAKLAYYPSKEADLKKLGRGIGAKEKI
jgi:hypothetical protein